MLDDVSPEMGMLETNKNIKKMEKAPVDPKNKSLVQNSSPVERLNVPLGASEVLKCNTETDFLKTEDSITEIVPVGTKSDKFNIAEIEKSNEPIKEIVSESDNIHKSPEHTIRTGNESKETKTTDRKKSNDKNDDHNELTKENVGTSKEAKSVMRGTNLGKPGPIVDRQEKGILDANRSHAGTGDKVPVSVSVPPSTLQKAEELERRPGISSQHVTNKTTPTKSVGSSDTTQPTKSKLKANNSNDKNESIDNTSKITISVKANTKKSPKQKIPKKIWENTEVNRIYEVTKRITLTG